MNSIAWAFVAGAFVALVVGAKLLAWLAVRTGRLIATWLFKAL